MNTIAINQSRPEDITMREDFGEINLGRQDDDFGDSAFDEASSREVIREGDKTYDNIYRGSGQLSVRGGTDFSIRSDQDMEATLIGGDHLDGRDKQDKHGDLAARADDIGIDDNDFGDGFLGAPDDDDENFGGEIDHSLFADAAIFEDPSAQKQLEHLTSEIESHMDTAGFGLHDGASPIPTPTSAPETATEQPELPAQEEIEKPAVPFPEVVTASGTDSNLSGLPLVTTMTNSRIGGESTTLLTNESEAFALPPIDTTSVMGTETKRGKRKRRLVVDELKSIPSETMKSQMEDTSDITTQLDLAPPTKKLMHWKETGSVDKLFSLPGRAIPSRVLQRLFVCNLHTVSVPDDAPEEQWQPLRVGLVPSTTTSGPHQTSVDSMRDESGQSAASETSSHQDLQISGKSPLLPIETTVTTDKLEVIKEISEEQSDRQSAEQQEAIADIDHDVLNANDDDYDDNMHDDLAFMGEPVTPYMPPPSVLSEAPPSVMQADMLALERELAEADDEAENQLALAFASANPDVAAGLAGATPSLLSPGTATNANDAESLEERRLEKRSKVLLRMLRAHQQQHGWEDPLSLHSICMGNTKKQAASKFYTVLLLRKQTAVELAQESPYADVSISRGPSFDRLVDM